MAKALNFLTKFLKSQYEWSKMSHEEKYLSQSTDRADLERRVKELRTPASIPSYRYWI